MSKDINAKDLSDFISMITGDESPFLSSIGKEKAAEIYHSWNTPHPLVMDTGVRRNIDMDGKLRQSIDVYMSDFGEWLILNSPHAIDDSNGHPKRTRKE